MAGRSTAVASNHASAQWADWAGFEGASTARPPVMSAAARATYRGRAAAVRPAARMERRGFLAVCIASALWNPPA